MAKTKVKDEKVAKAYKTIFQGARESENIIKTKKTTKFRGGK
jgi:hypothetical protein